MELLKEYLGMLASVDNPSPSGKAASFISLSGSKVQVEFEIIHKRLQLQALETACRDKHGSEGVRVMRLLLETGKMDEKQVNNSPPVAPELEVLTPADLQDSHDGTQGLPPVVIFTFYRCFCQFTGSSSWSGSKSDQNVFPLVIYQITCSKQLS